MWLSRWLGDGKLIILNGSGSGPFTIVFAERRAKVQVGSHILPESGADRSLGVGRGGDNEATMEAHDDTP